MTLHRVDELTTPPIVGKFYSVPTIRYLFGYSKKFANYPVMGLKHADAEFIGFPYDHYHMDWRFAPQSAVNYATRIEFDPQRIFGVPLQHRGLDIPPVKYVRLKCKREVPENVIFSQRKNGRELHRHWFGKDALRGPLGFICPHRGTSLASIPENADGTITCPLHGLKFCARTGKSVATHDMQVAA